MQNIHIFNKKIKKNLEKYFLVVTKGYIQRQGCALEKFLHLFEKFAIVFITVIPNKSLEYVLIKSQK